MISAIEFVNCYTDLLDTIDAMASSEMHPALRAMYVIDPHDLISPAAAFSCREHALGFVLTLVIQKATEIKNAGIQ